jgi:hypothetical protein
MTTSRRPLVVVAESSEGMVGATAPSARLRRDGRRPACGRRRITARPKRKPRRGSRGFGGRRSSRGKCDRPSRHGNTTGARSVHRTMSMSKNCRTGCSTGGPGSSRASRLRNMAGGCCGRLLGGEGVVTATLSSTHWEPRLATRHAAGTASCHCALASARKICSVDREMRWR